MAKRDPKKTARNKLAKQLSDQINNLLPAVLKETGIETQSSLHGKYGGKFADYIDIKNAVIASPDHFISLYLEGFRREVIASKPDSANRRNYELLRRSKTLKEYLRLFLRRTYFRYYDALSKKRPKVEEATIWIGQQNASWGLLVTPRFKKVTKQWENDRSEIRHFRPAYWSIGHVLATGLVVPGKDARQTFETPEEYLNFFVDVMVRNSGSPHEMRIAELYRQYVLNSPEPEKVQLLIPEYRYGGIASAHKYRLDFTVIDPHELSKIGFELSPWSTHGRLSKIKGLTQAEINKIAKGNFEKEMAKHKDFFWTHGIFSLIFTDSDLNDIEAVFELMKPYLNPNMTALQVQYQIIDELLGKSV